MKAPFPLKSVMPIMVKVTGWLKTIEDREDAIQDAWVDILQFPNIDKFPEGRVEAIIRRITYYRAVRIFRKNRRQASYVNTLKVFNSATGGVQEGENDYFPESTHWVNKDRELAEEVIYRRQVSQFLFSKLKFCTKKQQALIFLLMMGCTRREAQWIAGPGYKQVGDNEFSLARKKMMNFLAPEVKEEFLNEYRGSESRGVWRPSNRRQFYEDADGVHRYARPGSRAHEIYKQYNCRDPFTVGRKLRA